MITALAPYDLHDDLFNSTYMFPRLGLLYSLYAAPAHRLALRQIHDLLVCTRTDTAHIHIDGQLL